MYTYIFVNISVVCLIGFRNIAKILRYYSLQQERLSTMPL